MTIEEQDFIDGLNGKLYVMVMIDPKCMNEPKISHKMDRVEIYKKYNKMLYQYGSIRPMLGHFMYVARINDLDNPLEGTKLIKI